MSAYGRNSNGSTPLPAPVPPDIGVAAPRDRKGNLLILILFVLLLAGTGYVLVLLPSLLSQNSAALPEGVPAAPETAVKHKTAGSDPAVPEPNRMMEIKAALLELKIRAEAENIQAWAAEDYRKALENETRGNSSVNTYDYTNAEAAYRLAAEMLGNILDSRESRLKAALLAGSTALDDNNNEEAEKQFRLALALEPLAEQALEGLKQISIRHQTTALFAEAAALAESDRLPEAEHRLAQLLKLAPDNAAAEKELERIRKQRAGIDFQARMGEFFSFFKAGNLQGAAATLQEMRKQWQRHPQFLQAEKILKTRKEAMQVAKLLNSAKDAREAENWSAALESYEQVLAIAPAALLALDGKKTAADRLRLEQALSESIARPERLEDIVKREAAGKLLDYARLTEPAGPRLQSQIAALKQLITVMSTPVTVTINSDNLTEITIFRVGKLGRFYTRTLNLTPGTYTVSGARKGYRDIRKDIEISPETEVFLLTMQCNQPI